MGFTDVSVIDGLLTNAAELRSGLIGYRQGVLATEDFAVTQKSSGSNRSVDLASGRAIITSPVVTQPTYHCPNFLVSQEAALNSDAFPNGGIEAPHSTYARLDQLVLRLYDNEGGVRKWQPEILKGATPTTNATLSNRHNAAALPSGVPVFAICDIVVPVSGVITNSEIGDKRTWARQDAIRSKGKCIIPGTESRTNSSYGLMPTNDAVTVVLPTDGLIFALYQGTWQESNFDTGRAALFLNSDQLKTVRPDGPAIISAARTGAGTGSVDRPLSTWPLGLVSGGAGAGVASSDVTTGQVVGVASNALTWELGGSGIPAASYVGGICAIFAVAGIYTVSVQYKSIVGSVSTKNRRLWVWTMEF